MTTVFTLWQKTALSLILSNIIVPEVSNIIIEYLSNEASKEQYTSVLSNINHETCSGCEGKEEKGVIVMGPWCNSFTKTECCCIGTKRPSTETYYAGDYRVDGISCYRRCSLCINCWNVRFTRVMYDCPFCKRDIRNWLASLHRHY
jgi:alpha-glucuronidase